MNPLDEERAMQEDMQMRRDHGWTYKWDRKHGRYPIGGYVHDELWNPMGIRSGRPALRSWDRQYRQVRLHKELSRPMGGKGLQLLLRVQLEAGQEARLGSANRSLSKRRVRLPRDGDSPYDQLRHGQMDRPRVALGRRTVVAMTCWGCGKLFPAASFGFHIRNSRDRVPYIDRRCVNCKWGWKAKRGQGEA